MKQKRPEWLVKKINPNEQRPMKKLLNDLELSTICEEARCPNISECFSRKQATFLILGTVCTRQCRFCNVEKGRPVGIDPHEPERVSEAVKRLKLRHVVITSPTRDDLADGGAAHYAKVTRMIKTQNPGVSVELLIPDFRGDIKALETVLDSSPDILGHNLETVPRLYNIRKGSDYNRSLGVLQKSREIAPHVATKSGLMLGLGESSDEVLSVMKDLLTTGCRLLSLGQYLAPSKKHEPVHEYVTPKQFDYFAKAGKELGFDHIESGPYVRSSYHADEYLEKKNKTRG